jgi:hypothetical protein
MKKYCFGIDVGGTSVKCGLFTVDGDVLDKWEIKTRTEENGKYILPDIADAINTVKANPQADTLEQKRALLAEGIQALSVKHHLEVPATATQYVAAFLIEQFDAVPTVTLEVIDNWLNHYAEDILANGIPENIQQWIPSGVDPSQLLPPQP